MLNKLKNLFKKKSEPVKITKSKSKTKKITPLPELSAKDRATAAGEPYINIIKMELDPNNIHTGSFDLDWNDLFVARLVKAGYMMKKDDTDIMIVDRWFQNVCRNIALEMYEQTQADPTLRTIQTKDLGDGRTEIS